MAPCSVGQGCRLRCTYALHTLLQAPYKPQLGVPALAGLQGLPQLGLVQLLR